MLFLQMTHSTLRTRRSRSPPDHTSMSAESQQMHINVKVWEKSWWILRNWPTYRRWWVFPWASAGCRPYECLILREGPGLCPDLEQQREEGNIIQPAQPAKSPSATSSACQSSHGVLGAAKLHHVYTTSSYVCLDRRCGGWERWDQMRSSAWFFLVLPSDMSAETIKQAVPIDVWPWSSILSDDPLCHRGQLLEPGCADLLS